MDPNELKSAADSAMSRNDYAGAETALRELLDAYAASNSYDPVEIAGTLHNLALALEGQQKTDEALSVRQKARQILTALSQADNYRRDLKKQLGELSTLHAESLEALKKLADSFSNRDQNRS